MTLHLPVRIGVLGAAAIVGDALLEPARSLEGVAVTALAARDPARARRYAERHGIPRVHDSYDALLRDPEIDAVYIPQPAALHARWTIAAIDAGKHVLVEKPFTSNSAAAERVAEYSRPSELVVMEGYHSHYHPIQSQIRAVLTSGEIGRIRSARAHFCIPIPPGKNIRWNRELGGGSLLDIGYYPVRQLTELFGSPVIGEATARLQRGVDRRVDARLEFEGDITGHIISSMWSMRVFSIGLRITGELGVLTVRSPYHPHLRGRLAIKSAAGTRIERTERRSTYSYQLQAFRDAIQGDRPVETGVEAAVEHMRTLDAIYRRAGVRPRG